MTGLTEALVAAVADNPSDLARQAALADHLQECSGEIMAAIALLAGWVDMRCPNCDGKGGSLFDGACYECNGGGRREPK